MLRRDFIAGLGGAAVVGPRGAWGQPRTLPIVGLLNGASPGEFAPHVAAIKRGLGEQGSVEGRDFDTVHLWADSRPERLPEIAAEMVRRNVAVIATVGGGAVVTRAAKAATLTIPIVFVVAGDPVSIGLVGSINRPGANIIGISLLYSETAGKRLGLLRELLPQTKTIGWMVNPNAGPAVAEARDAQELATTLGLQTLVLPVQTEGDVNNAFDTLVEKQADALIVSPDAFVVSRRYQLADLATRHRIPVMYPTRDFPAVGGLISYGTSLLEGYRQSGQYVGRILHGAKPADLPILQLSKFEFVVNVTAAKKIGLPISEAFLLRADEVIE